MNETTLDHELFHKAVDQAGYAVVITDRDGAIEYVNPAFERTTGYSFSEAVGRNPRILKSGKHDDEFYAELWDTILDGEVWRAELVNKRKTGELYHIEQTIAPLIDENGATHFVGIEHDITDRRLRAQRLMVLNRILRHNLRNALTVIDGHASNLADELADDSLQSDVEPIQQEVHNLQEIVADTDTVKSFFDYPPETLSSSGVDVVKLLNELKADLAERYPAATLTFYTDFPSCEIHADERLKRAIREGIDNAVRHNDQANPSVDITATTENGSRYVAIAIADDGPGIPEAERAAIKNETETSLVHGLGIGMWLIKWIVASFGGDVTFTENDPRGSILVLRIPTVD